MNPGDLKWTNKKSPRIHHGPVNHALLRHDIIQLAGYRLPVAD